ncbi:MAG: IPT/TIG domain-containing protein [Planctomycetes bacterium]|nr:IPT/TIG domain-containing protein [Planctomycetota bacterium]
MRRLPPLLAAALVCAAPAATRAFELIGLRWPSGSVGFRVNPGFDTARGGSTEQQIEIIRCAAAAWRDQSRASFQFTYQGTTTRKGFNENDGLNVVSFVSSDGGDALAATLISGEDGIARSFDVVFFGTTGGNSNRWSGPGEPGTGELDIGGVATHELGHALGLDHTPVSEATMFASASGRALHLRTLAADDRQGIESIYGLRTQAQPQVQITSVTPSEGPPEGGNEVVVEGLNFTYDSESQLLLGGAAVPGTRWNIETCTRIRITSMPAHAPGTVSLQVSSSIGSRTLESAYRYGGPLPQVASVEPSEGPITGSILVTVKGTSFLPEAVASVGGKPLLDQTFVDATTLRGTLPPGDAGGPADVRVVQGEDQAVLPSAFNYVDFVLSLGSASGAPGQTSIPVDVRATSPANLTSASFGFTYTALLVAVRQVSVAGTDASLAEFVGADIDNDAGVTTVGIVMDLDGSAISFPAGTDRLLARVLADVSVAAVPGLELPLRLKDNVGSPPIELIFTRVGSSAKIRPFTLDGKVDVTEGVRFGRGDANGDDKVDISDAVFHLDFLFRGGPGGPCEDAADSNDDGRLDISDAIRTLRFLFQGSEGLPPPSPGPGLDPTPDALSCRG